MGALDLTGGLEHRVPAVIRVLLACALLPAVSATAGGVAALPRKAANVSERAMAVRSRQVITALPRVGAGREAAEEAPRFSPDRAQQLATSISVLEGGSQFIVDEDSLREAMNLLPSFKAQLSKLDSQGLSGAELLALEAEETKLEDLEGMALKGRHRCAIYRPERPAALPDGIVPSRNAEEWRGGAPAPDAYSKINTGWILDQHMFDPESPKTFPTFTSDFKHYDEGENDMAMGHSEHPSGYMFGWVWQVQTFYWTDTTLVTDHPNASYCLIVMCSGDGGSTWFMYEILYDPSSTASKDMINPRMAMDITGTGGGGPDDFDRYYIAYEYCYSASDHDVYVHSDTSTLPFYDGSPGGTSNPYDVGVATSASWEGNPSIASDYKTTEASYRVVAYEYATSSTVHDIYAAQSTGNGSTWTTAVVVTGGVGMSTHPALTAGCSGGSTFTAYMHLAYNYDTYTASGAQLLLNPGFEFGNNGNWTVRVASDINGSGSYSRTGSYCAWLGGVVGYPSWPGDWIYQSVTIPPGVQSSALSFWVRISSSDSATDAHDFFYADVRDASGNLLQNLVTLSNADQAAYSSYQQLTFDISSFHGQTIRIYFWSTNDASLTTSFFVDDTAINDGVYNTDSEVRYAKAAHPGTAYPAGLASFTKLTVLANAGGTVAWPYGPPAITATHGGSAVVTGGRVVVAADQFFPQNQPTAGDAARYQLNYAVSMCNGTGGTSCGYISGCSPAVSLNWNAYYFYDNRSDYRFPSLVVDGVGWVQGTSSTPQNGVNVWPEVFMGYYKRTQGTTSEFGSAEMIVAFADDEKCDGFAAGAWYLFTAAEQASDEDYQVVAKPGTLATFNYFGGWPGLCFNKRLNHLGANVNDDVYFTTLGDNYTIDTTSQGSHIDAFWQFNLTSYVGPWTYPWPAGIEWVLTADSTEIVDFRYYNFSAWSTGGTDPAVTILSDWCYYGSTTCPVTTINALYDGGCLIEQPSVTGLLLSKQGSDALLAWDQAGATGDVGAYAVYRAADPASVSNFTQIGSSQTTGYTDSSATDPLDCYVIVATCGPYSGPWDCYGQ